MSTINVSAVKSALIGELSSSLSRFVETPRKGVLAEIFPERLERFDRHGNRMRGTLYVRHDVAPYALGNLYEMTGSGECMAPHFIEGDISWLDGSRQPVNGDIVLIQVPRSSISGDDKMMKCMISYQGRQLFVSNDPPLAFDPRMKVLGAMVAYLHTCTIRSPCRGLPNVRWPSLVSKP